MKISNLNIHNLISSVKFIAVMPAALLTRKWRRDIWIISERPGQARDNGYCFFKYLRENQPDCKAYYIIQKEAEDYQKVKKYGNIIPYDSWKHYFYYCLSTVHISAHVNGCRPSDSPICRRIKGLLKTKDVFLPHGVSYGISEFCLKKYAKIDLFICSGKPEYENVLKNYGYSESEVAYTGFPRLDEWHNINVNPRQIVLMPTWRLYLAQNPDTVFEETTYFNAYQSLLEDEELGSFLVEHGLKLIFYPHNEMRKYVGAFKTDCLNIEIAYRDECHDIQELLKASAMLITDYSSVHFDFAYMNKPVIYFQFDQKEFFDCQYKRGLFDVEKDGFGPVVFDKEMLLEELKSAFQDTFQMPEKYHERMRKFYQIYDNKNCERVYDAIHQTLRE